MNENRKTEPVPTLVDINAKLDEILSRILFHESKLDDLLAKVSTLENQ